MMVLYCTIPYCTVLYCTVLYCTVLYCTFYFFSAVFSDDTQLNKQRISVQELVRRADRGVLDEKEVGIFMSHLSNCRCNRLISVSFSQQDTVEFNRLETLVESGITIYAGMTKYSTVQY